MTGAEATYFYFLAYFAGAISGLIVSGLYHWWSMG